MNNQEVAILLRKIAAAYEIKKENRFKIVAYEKAADSIEHLTSEVKDLWDDGKLNEVSGIGASIASHLDEFFRTGRVKHFEKVMRGLPKAMFSLLSLPGFGAKKAYRLVKHLKLSNPATVIDEVKKAAKKGKIAPLEAFGEKSQQAIIESIENFKRGQTKKQRMLLPYADAIAEELIAYLEKNPKVVRADPLGSLRRMVTTIGDLDIAVSTKEPREVIAWFLKFPKIRKIIEKGISGASVILVNVKQADLRVQKPPGYGAMLQYFTGSKHHNIHLREYALKRGFSLSEYGIKQLKNKKFASQSSYEPEKVNIKEFSTEEAFYHAIGLPWIPPEIREDRGEIEAALAGKLPKLVKLDDVKGDLHSHSNFDLEPSHDLGADSFKTMVAKAAKLGYEYLAFSEHNPSLSRHSKKQIIAIMKRRKKIIDQIKLSIKHTRVKIINSIEVDVLPDGKIALPEEAFDDVDFLIVGVHSSFNQPRKEMTDRILKALSYFKVKILAHPTGRLLNKREGYELDWEAIFDFCKRHNKALEINCHPERLDLPDVLVRRAIEKGIKLTLGSDAHRVEAMETMKYGVSVARRGWCEKGDILNTLPYNKLVKWLMPAQS